MHGLNREKLTGVLDGTRLARMVKELDLFESNDGCKINGLSSEKHSKLT